MGLSLKPAAGVRIIKDLKGLIKSIVIAARRKTNQGGAGPRQVREAWRNWPPCPVMWVHTNKCEQKVDQLGFGEPLLTSMELSPFLKVRTRGVFFQA